MRARILIGLLVISAATALLVGGLAQFTGSGTGAGSVGAGTVDVTVTDPLVFEESPGVLCGPMGIGDSCTESDAVATNTGTLTADITISLSQVESVPGCFSIAGTAAGAPLPDTTLGVASGGTISPISVTVTLDAPGPTIDTNGDGVFDDDDCEGATTDVTVTADAVQS